MAKSKMENKKVFVGLLLTSLLFLSVVPYFKVSAQTCDPDALRPVSYGQRGAAVKNVQACLIDAGYNISAGATGYYGKQTQQAVTAFYADWYGKWHGRSLGPRGVQELKNLVAGTVPGRGEEQSPAETQQPSTGVSNETLMQALMLILAGKTNEAMALLQGAGLQLPLPTSTVVTTTTTPTQEVLEGEGFLNVEKDPSVGVVTLREGETARVAGIRFRADNGAVAVKTIFLRWSANAAPHRVISSLTVKDSAGNVLYQTNVGPSTFLQDSSLNYYLPVSGLNVVVPRNGYNSVFVEATVVGTLPSGVTSAQLYVDTNEIRGTDGVGIDRFGPSSPLTWNFNLGATLSANAYFVGARNETSPLEGYVVGDVNTFRKDQALVYKFDLTAKNDSLRLTQVTGSVSNTSTVSAVYLRQGNLILDSQTPASNGSFTFNVTPSNFVINKDQTMTFDILVDLVNGTSTQENTTTVTISQVAGLNSLGDQKSTPLNLTSEVMRFLTVGPEMSVSEKLIQVTKDQNNVTTTVSLAMFKVAIKAVGGNLYIPTTSMATITIETAGGVSQNVSVNPSSVYLGSTVVNPQSGWYVIPEGSTYVFELKTSGQTFTGIQSLRAKLSSIEWGPSQSTQFNANFLINNSNYWTNSVSP